MRRIIPEPELFRGKELCHKQARELAMIDRILVANPSAAEAVWKDLEGPLAKTGRRGTLSRSGIARSHHQTDDRIQLFESCLSPGGF